MRLSSATRSRMVLLMLGGALGTYLRYQIGFWVNEQSWGRSFPWATLFINVSGSFLLGLVAVLIGERLSADYQHWYLLLGTGFCGGYTTFSTFELETFKFVREGSWGLALLYVGGSVVAGFLALVAAVALAHALFPPPA